VIYLEFEDFVVEMGEVPSKICCVKRPNHDSRMFNILSLANRAYSVEENTVTEIKNRNRTLGTMFISDEDKVVLKLSAVLLCK
jgi:hypothetical protein